MVHHIVSLAIASVIDNVVTILRSRYPVLYCILVLPLTVVRFLTFNEEKKYGEAKPRPVATFVVITIFSLSGVLNALLYRLTRPAVFRGDPIGIPDGPRVGGDDQL